ncbi:MAG: response regulator [Anaerolineae bacterium]|nr:response regulator [Anaerolineae bacterium]
MPSKRVLIVEDNPDNCQLLSIIFGNPVYEVHEARTGADGLTLIRDASFDLGLFDIQLPDANGLTLARYLHKQNPEAKIVVLSALDDTHLIEQSAELGARAYVVKPFDLPVLIQFFREIETYPPNDRIKIFRA